MFADLITFISSADKTSLLVKRSFRISSVKYYDLYIISDHHLNILLKNLVSYNIYFYSYILFPYQRS